jgi:hypothetical protein
MTFNLSEKREKIFDELENLELAEYNTINDRISIVARIIKLIKEQDKEFIKLLKYWGYIDLATDTITIRFSTFKELEGKDLI